MNKTYNIPVGKPQEKRSLETEIPFKNCKIRLLFYIGHCSDSS
jgi:hypothetical protein